MSHQDRCIRSDGDWMCTPDCTHDQDEELAELEAAACAVADTYVLGNVRGTGTKKSSAILFRALMEDCRHLEVLTRASPLRKVKP